VYFKYIKFVPEKPTMQKINKFIDKELISCLSNCRMMRSKGNLVNSETCLRPKEENFAFLPIIWQEPRPKKEPNKNNICRLKTYN